MAEAIVRPAGWKRVFYLIGPLLALAVGMAVNNAKAVLEAAFGKPSEFVRTPKFGESKEGQKSIEKRSSGYKALKSVVVPVLELMFGLFFGALEVYYLVLVCTGSFSYILNIVLMAPFMGFFYTSICSIARLLDARRQRMAAQSATKA